MALSSKQLAAIPILIGYDTVEGAAKAAGISKNTLYTWMQQEEFSKALSAERKKLIEKAMNKLMNVSMKAVRPFKPHCHLERLFSFDEKRKPGSGLPFGGNHFCGSW